MFIDFDVAYKVFRIIASVVEDSEKHKMSSNTNKARVIKWMTEHLEEKHTEEGEGESMHLGPFDGMWLQKLSYQVLNRLINVRNSIRGQEKNCGLVLLMKDANALTIAV